MELRAPNDVMALYVYKVGLIGRYVMDCIMNVKFPVFLHYAVPIFSGLIEERHKNVYLGIVNKSLNMEVCRYGWLFPFLVL